MNYPIFNNPKEYLTFRKGNFFTAPFRRWFEWHSLDLCFKGINDIETVCDCPCGPGRLFDYWKKRGMSVTGADLSDSMVAAARLLHNDLSLNGDVLKADAFNLHKSLNKKPDLIASVRFCYYFDKAQRIELLRSFAQATNNYLLLQYKTSSTLRGRKNLKNSLSDSYSKKDYAKKFCSYESIADEVRQAGLACLRIVPKGDSSDRVFVLAQKPAKAVRLEHRTKIHRPSTLRNAGLAVAAVMMLAVGLVFYKNGLLFDTHEKQVEAIAQKYQDGNDHFYVIDKYYFESLHTGKRFSLINELDDMPALAMIDETQGEDSFFLVEEKDLRVIRKCDFGRKLNLIKKTMIGKDKYVLLSTEKIIHTFDAIENRSHLTEPSIFNRHS